MKLRRIIQMTCIAALGLTISPTYSQVASHPEAKSPLPDNPYMKHADAWRWDVHSQIFVRSAVETRRRRIQNPEEEARYERSTRWALEDLEVIYPVAREGGFYWSPNREVDVSLRVGDRVLEPDRKQMFTKGTHAEYTLWRSDIKDWVSAIHLIHDSHIVVADTIFDEKKARQLPWPDSWAPEASRWLSPVVDPVGKEVDADAADTVNTLLDFWVDNGDPKQLPEVDLVKFLSGKVIEHVQVRKPPAETTTRNTGRNTGVNFAFIGGLSTAGFIVRSADEIARDPKGSKHDLAALLTSVLRSAGVPARTVICVDTGEEPNLEQIVSLVEFAMYDPDRKLTFWVPIDIDRLRLNGKRANQYKQPWLYFGTHDELNEYVPVAYYFHPPASYRAYDLPALFGLRSKSELPEYAVQGLLIDPQVTPITAQQMNPSKP
ncbi:MAG: transglutaminase-like domain-containing protein [Phycisphaerales bacterium]